MTDYAGRVSSSWSAARARLHDGVATLRLNRVCVGDRSLLNYAAMPVIESSLRPVNELNEGEGSAVGHRAKRILSIGRFGKTAPEVLVFKGDDIFGGEISDSLII